jgi:ABC-2 type transport system permease protein
VRRLVAAELAKLATTRLWLWLLLASMALTALYVSLSIAFADAPDTTTLPPSTPAGQRMLFALAASGPSALVAVLGAIGLTGEYRHRTATATFLATPHRGRVVAAKLLTYALAGAGYGAACIAVTTAITLPWLAAKHIHVPLTGHGIPATLAAVLAAVTIYAILGVGLGALLRDQVATVVALLVYLFVAEPIITRIPALASWTTYLPGPAEQALTQLAQRDRDLLAPWQGGLLFAAYGIAFAVAGTFLAVHRDVT